jgi:molybdate transport system regulatory protein
MRRSSGNIEPANSPRIFDIRLRVISQDEPALGPGKADLLEQIDASGSISKAAGALEMSYSRAWRLVETMNSLFRAPLVATSAGGRRGGGARLTPEGREVLALYRSLEARLLSAAEPVAAEFSERLR